MCAGAAWPISLSERKHRHVSQVLERAARRQVLFPDDIAVVQAALEQVGDANGRKVLGG